MLRPGQLSCVACDPEEESDQAMSAAGLELPDPHSRLIATLRWAELMRLGYRPVRALWRMYDEGYGLDEIRAVSENYKSKGKK